MCDLTSLATSVEHLPRTQNVVGSSPALKNGLVLYCFGSLLVRIFREVGRLN